MYCVILLLVLAGDGRSPQWPAVRAAWLCVHPECAACGARKELRVHHIVPVHVDPARECDLANLLTLCDRCHLLIGHLGDYRSWNADVVADAARLREKVRNRPYFQLKRSLPRDHWDYLLPRRPRLRDPALRQPRQLAAALPRARGDLHRRGGSGDVTAHRLLA
jgi:hypothetical protein